MKERSKKDLWKICWRLTRIFFNQINILGGGNMKKGTLISIIDMRRDYRFLLDEETNDTLDKARKIYSSREWAKENTKDKKGFKSWI